MVIPYGGGNGRFFIALAPGFAVEKNWGYGGCVVVVVVTAVLGMSVGGGCYGDDGGGNLGEVATYAVRSASANKEVSGVMGGV